jgi:hypothetical protein
VNEKLNFAFIRYKKGIVVLNLENYCMSLLNEDSCNTSCVGKYMHIEERNDGGFLLYDIHSEGNNGVICRVKLNA